MRHSLLDTYSKIGKSISISATALILLSGCNRVFSGSFEAVSGDGHITSETRTLQAFNSIDLEGSYDVELAQSTDGATSIRIETDKNILPLVKTTVESGRLVVNSDENLKPSKRMKVFITTPEYKIVDIDGAADVHGSTPIKSDDLTLSLQGSGSYLLEVHTAKLASDVDGSGKFSLSGNAGYHKVTINGSGDLAAYQLPTDSTSVNISGSGNANVTVAQSLDASISGSGNIRYKGNASQVKTDISGSGKIEKVN